jgi:hypothetical protein
VLHSLFYILTTFTMKTASLFIAVSLALSSSAAVVQANRNSNNRNAFGNNNGGFGAGNNRFGAIGGNDSGNNNSSSQGGKENQQTNKGNNNNGNNNGGNGKGSVLAGVGNGQAGSNVTSNATATATSSSNDNGNLQASLTLDPKVIATGFADNGQDVPTAGQVASLTSTNNFINFCLTVPQLPITNGKQITTGSCNPAPMGVIPSTDNMPSSKFTIPKNGDVLQENTPFTITMAVSNFETGNFVNADENYFAAPQQVNAQGQIIGHSHVVVESLSALDQTTTTDPRKFAFFKGLNAAAVNGILTASVAAGLPAGFYKVSSINTAANHQPVLVPVAQHGSLDDAVYFTVSASGASNSTAGAAAAGTAGSDGATAAGKAGTKGAGAATGKGGKAGQQNNKGRS